MAYSTIKASSFVFFIMLCGCNPSIKNLSCEDIENEVVDLSKGELLKITGAKLISQTDTEIVCHGNGVYSDAEDLPIQYRGYLDEDKEIMVEYNSE
jgi:hypothetical protein